MPREPADSWTGGSNLLGTSSDGRLSLQVAQDPGRQNLASCPCRYCNRLAETGIFQVPKASSEPIFQESWLPSSTNPPSCHESKLSRIAKEPSWRRAAGASESGRRKNLGGLECIVRKQETSHSIFDRGVSLRELVVFGCALSFA